MHPDFCELLIPADRIAHRVGELGREITGHYAKQGVDRIVVVGVLNGAVVFLSDLIRCLPLRTQLGLIAASSYAGKTTVSSGQVAITQHLAVDVAGRHVLLMDDILDTGRTLATVQRLLREAGAADVATAVLLHKPGKEAVAVSANFIGFVIPDRFVVGYGLDYNGQYRNVPDIGVLKPELYA